MEVRAQSGSPRGGLLGWRVLEDLIFRRVDLDAGHQDPILLCVSDKRVFAVPSPHFRALLLRRALPGIWKLGLLVGSSIAVIWLPLVVLSLLPMLCCSPPLILQPPDSLVFCLAFRMRCLGILLLILPHLATVWVSLLSLALWAIVWRAWCRVLDVVQVVPLIVSALVVAGAPFGRLTAWGCAPK